jgi:drug/metabolite transporter (DMT)-like permease
MCVLCPPLILRNHKEMIYLILGLGIFSCSTAVIFIKLSDVHPFLLAGYRTILAAALLLPLFVRQFREHRIHLGWHYLLPAATLAAHFITWTIGARATDAANATLIVNMAPLAMPFFLFMLMGEVLNWREIAGTILALAGVFALAGRDYAIAREHFAGDVISLISMLLFALYLALGRLHRGVPGIWLYVVPVYGLCGVFCLVAAAPVTDLARIFSVREYLLLLALALVPTIIGHSCLNYALKHLRGQAVSICNLGQIFFASVMAFFLFGEVPQPIFYIACTLIGAGIYLAIRSRAGTRHLSDAPEQKVAST